MTIANTAGLRIDTRAPVSVGSRFAVVIFGVHTARASG